MQGKQANKLTLGEAIRAKREPQMSLRELARRSGISAAYLSDIERGNRSPGRCVMENIAVALGAPKLAARFVSDRIDFHREQIARLRVGRTK